MKKMFLMLMLIALLSSCYSRAYFTPSDKNSFKPRVADWTQIKIYTNTPSIPFVEIGFLQGEFDSGVRTPSGNIEILKYKAFEVGADAIINLNCNPGSGWGPGYCQGTAIRFKP